MKTVIEFVKKYKVYILATLLALFFFRSCIKSGQVRKLEKTNSQNQEVVDSLNTIINNQADTITNFPEVMRKEKIKIHTEYDNYISEKDRGNQLMELHMIVKDNLKELQK
jgi:hypothetical protein